ncbi:hypothetical protein ACWF94_29030 [Streptomyces sp. NPDC055078]
MNYIESGISAIVGVAAVAACVIAYRSMKTAERAAGTAERAAQTAEQAARAAEAVATIERDRWHADMKPRLTFTIDGLHSPVLTVLFTGPTSLGRLERVELTIRDESDNHGHQLAGGPSPEDLAAVIWGPLRFLPGAGDASHDGRKAGVFPLELNETRMVAMDPTLVPRWYERRRWWQKWVNQPVRLWVTCQAEGHQPWTVSEDVMPDQDIIDVLIG